MQQIDLGAFMLVLTLDVSGMPREWVTVKDAVSYYTTEKVLWTLGDKNTSYHCSKQPQVQKRKSWACKPV